MRTSTHHRLRHYDVSLTRTGTNRMNGKIFVGTTGRTKNYFWIYLETKCPDTLQRLRDKRWPDANKYPRTEEPWTSTKDKPLMP